MKKILLAIIMILAHTIAAFAGERANSHELDRVNSGSYVYVDNSTGTTYRVNIADGTVSAGLSAKSTENRADRVADSLQKTGGKVA